MPCLASSSYRAPFGFGNGHVQTIYPALFRRVAPVTTQRERIELPDGDFLDVDWTSGAAGKGERRVAVLSHGMEGDSSQTYIQGMAAALRRRGWDVAAWNFRGCSGEPNRLARAYHSGATEDLQAVLDRVFATGYERVALVSFSLGGNVTLKYLGDRGADIDERIRGAVAFSVPCDLSCSARTMERFSRRIYKRRLLEGLKEKVREKAEQFPDRLSTEGVAKLNTFRDFDDRFTAPLNGFKDASEYWRQCSSKRVLSRIRIPTLLVNAADDPFLGDRCYPEEEAKASGLFFLEIPKKGGHVGFVPRGRVDEYWSDTRAAEFLERPDSDR